MAGSQIIVASNPRVPFSAARRIMSEGFGAETPADLRSYARPITHENAYESASLSDRQDVDRQLRFYTKYRALRGFHAVAQALASSGVERITVIGLADHSDMEFLKICSSYVPVTVEASTTRTSDLSGADQRDEFFLDTVRAVRKGTGQVSGIVPKIRHYLNIGDSWSAAKLADAMLKNSNIPDGPEVGEVMGLAYGLQDRSADAEAMFKLWMLSGGISAARAKYSLAMMQARHNPVALRTGEQAADYLESAWADLVTIEETPQVVFEKVFNRNGMALILFRQKRYAEAAALLETGIARLEEYGRGGNVHHTVLLNNLARIYAAQGDLDRGIATQRKALHLDPAFSEYWQDLAQMLLDSGQDGAEEAAARACSLDPANAEARAFLGYLSSRSGDHSSASDHYTFAARTALDDAAGDYWLSAAREASEADDPRRMKEALREIEIDTLLGEAAVEFELLDLETRLPAGTDTLIVQSELEKLSLKYPDSELIAANLQEFAEGR